MASLKGTSLEPPFIEPTASPRAGVAVNQVSTNGKGRGRRPGAVSFDPPTLEVWEAIVDAFRLHPGHVVNAARRAGHKVTPAYAKYAWENGWWNVTGCETMIPVRDVIASEIATARAIMVRQSNNSTATVDTAKLAAKDAVEAAVIDIGKIRATESKSLQVAQGVTLSALAASMAVSKVLPALAASIATAIGKEAKNMSAVNQLKFWRQFTEVTHLSISQAKIVAELRGRLLGEADITIAHEHHLPNDFTSEETAVAELREAARIMERYGSNNVVDTTGVEVYRSEEDDLGVEGDFDLFDEEEGADSEQDLDDEDPIPEDGEDDLSLELYDDDSEDEEEDDEDDDSSPYIRRRIRPGAR